MIPGNARCGSGGIANKIIPRGGARAYSCCCASAASGPSRCAAEQRDELAARHSITSSARARTVAGRSRPSAFAVLRLTTSSYLFGRLDRQFGWLLAPEDAIDVHGCLPELIGGVVPIRGHFFYGSSELLRTDVLLGSFGALNRVRNSQPAPHIINWQAGMSVRMQFSAGAYTSAFDLR